MQFNQRKPAMENQQEYNQKRLFSFDKESEKNAVSNGEGSVLTKQSKKRGYEIFG